MNHSPTAQWQQGWCNLAQHLPSPNYNTRPAATSIDLLVIHSISLPPGQYGGPHIAQLFTNTLDFDAHPYFQQIRGLQVSSHFVIQRTGHIQQFVSCNHRAWHAGTSHWRGRDNCNDHSIGIELEGLEGDLFEPAQYATLSALCASVLQRYPIAHLAGHEHIAPGRKRDPGAGFDWQRLQRSLALDARQLPAAVRG